MVIPLTTRSHLRLQLPAVMTAQVGVTYSILTPRAFAIASPMSMLKPLKVPSGWRTAAGGSSVCVPSTMYPRALIVESRSAGPVLLVFVAPPHAAKAMAMSGSRAKRLMCFQAMSFDLLLSIVPPTSLSKRLLGNKPAVDREVSASDETGIVGGEE